MFTGKNEQSFLPVWSGGRLIFFTNIVMAHSSRLNYLAVAATQAGESKVTRTGKGPIDGPQLALCQEIADDPIALQKFFANIGSGNIDDFISTLEGNNLPCPDDANKLIYVCLYLDFLRKYAVDTEITRMYSKTPAAQRFNADRSVGIYKILTSRLQSAAAEVLIDADIAGKVKIAGASMSVANLLRECAMVKNDLKKFDEAEAFMLRAVKLHDTEDKWRRLADFATDMGDRPKAIKYFVTAHQANPLPKPAALVLAKHYLAEGQLDNAREFANQAKEMFEKPVTILLEKIDAAESA